MKVSCNAREKYMQLCPTSTRKCNSFVEIDAKIIRAAYLGKLLSWQDENKEILYYDLILHVLDDTIMDIIKDKTEYFHVSERTKRNYTNKVEKIVV